MRVLFVTGMHPSRAHPLRGIVIQRLRDALEQRGHRIADVFLGEEAGPRRYWSARTVVRDLVERLHPDLVHIHFGYSGLAVPTLSIPLVTSFYGDDLNIGWSGKGFVRVKSGVGRVVSQITAWRSARCIVVSKSLRDRLWLRSSRAKTVVVRDAVDRELFRPIARSVARARLDLPSGDMLVIFPHRAEDENKRVWLADAAVTQLRGRLPTARLWVVNGKPPDEMPWYYAAADIMIVTSRREGGPSSVKEALACGLPVVSVRVGDVELFNEVGNGMFAAGDTPTELAQALALAADFSQTPRRSLLPPDLSLPLAAAQVEAIYRSVVGTPQ